MMGCLKFDIDLFAARLCESMEKAKVSSAYLAAFLGVAPHTIVAWRMGRSTPNAERLCYISQALKVPVGYLLGLRRSLH